MAKFYGVRIQVYTEYSTDNQGICADTLTAEILSGYITKSATDALELGLAALKARLADNPRHYIIESISVRPGDDHPDEDIDHSYTEET